MRPEHLQAVITDIEKNLEGDGYTVNVSTRGGRILEDYAFQYLEGPRPSGPVSLIVLSKSDHPPVYVEVESIETVELCN